MKKEEPADDERSYVESTQGLNEMGTLVVNLIRVLLASKNIVFHTIEHRVKSEESALKKVDLKRGRYTSASDLTDLLGIRIITFFEDAVDSVSQLLESEFIVDKENSTDKRENMESDRFGYLSRHYVLSLSSARCELAEYSRFTGTSFEVQIRTILQHAWAEIEHDIGYKTDKALPRLLRRRFSRVAGLLEVADAEFLALRAEVEKYGREVRNEINRSPEMLDVDQQTITELIRASAVVRDIDWAIADLLHGTFDSNSGEYMASSVAGTLKRLGYTNIEKVQTALSGSREGIIRFAENWIGSQRSKYPYDRTLARGISLFYLCYYDAASQSLAETVAVLVDLSVGVDEFREDIAKEIRAARHESDKS